MAIGGGQLAPSEPVQDAARECVDDEDRSAKRVQEDVVRCFLADAVYVQELASQIGGVTLPMSSRESAYWSPRYSHSAMSRRALTL